MTVKGVDVASYQSKTFSTSGLSFAFVKATEGTSYVSPVQAAQAAHARAAGLVLGFYHFLHPGSAKAQAAYFVEKCASQAGDILACDWEPTSSGLASNADKDTFIKEVKRLRPDHPVVLYCDVSRWTGVDKTSYCGDGLWIADPNHPAGKPNIDHPWTFHQYGISGTDVDVANFASKAALAAWATGGTPNTPEDDDVAELTAAQVFDAVWKKDNEFAAPADTADHATNKYWTPQSFLTDTGARVRKLTDAVADLQKAVAALPTEPAALTDAQVTQIGAALASNPGLVGALAAAVADQLAQRLDS